MKIPILVVSFMSLAGGTAWAGTDAGVDCALEKYRCDAPCQCPVPTLESDQPCNDLPNGALAVSYPTAADDVNVLCPEIYMQGAADDESRIGSIFYRVELALDNNFTTLTYDSGLITAAPGTTQFRVAPNALYPVPTQAGTGYWLRVTDNDDCSVPPAGPYYANPNPWISFFNISADAQDNCLGGGDTDVDTDADTDTDTGGGDGGGGSSGCGCTTVPTPGAPAAIVLAGVLIVLRRRHP